jgi:hypothetical protein
MRALVASAAIAVFVASMATALACGTDRWPVNTATDLDAGQIVLTLRTATIAQLRNIQEPAHPNTRRARRFAPVETGVATIQGILTVIKHEQDEDYHLVISDPSDPSGKTTMIVEAPNPPCAAGSRFINDIVRVRQTIVAFFRGPIRGRHDIGIPITVTGIPFFDVLHGQEGVAPNGIELHPILAIQFPARP